MHEIHLGMIDVPLPAKVACPTASKGVECYLADETNDLGFAGSDGLSVIVFSTIQPVAVGIKSHDSDWLGPERLAKS